MRLFALAVLALAPLSVAHAQERVTTLELGEWASAVAALQADVDAQGRVVHVCVDVGDHACAPCDRYTLSLDDAGARAFRLDACDASTGATRVVLVDRSALFDHDDVVPRPRVLTIHAALMRDVSSSGGTRAMGGTALSCTARLSPFLRDLEHGTVLHLAPDRYDVRVESAAVTATPIDGGWILSTSERIASEVDYVVVDRVTEREELRGHAGLVCTAETSADTIAPSVPPPPLEAVSVGEDPVPLPERSAHFTIRGSLALDFGFAQVNVGGAGAIGARGWLDSGHWLSWSSELVVGGFHASCGAFDGRCGTFTTPAPPLSVDVVSFAAPFSLGVSLVPAGGLQLVVGAAPGVAYVFGANGGHVDAAVATGTVFGGLEYRIDMILVGVHAGYRFAAIGMEGEAALASGLGAALVMESTVGVRF